MARSRRMSPGPFFGLRGGGGASFTRKSVAFKSNKCTSPTMRSTLRTRCIYAQAIYRDPAATLDHLRESMTTLEETARTARRVLGGAHPLAVEIERSLGKARAAVRARETPPRSA